MKNQIAPQQSSIMPWLSVNDGEKAEKFYKTAFGATETYRFQNPDGGLVLKLSVVKPASFSFALSLKFNGFKR
ncbi:MAG: hypothetical protein ACR2FN_01590 [Chitinophagaceae bacterium]